MQFPPAASCRTIGPGLQTVGGAREQASECKAASRVNGDRIRPMRLWRGAPGNRLPGVLGLARPLAIDPARAWRRLCHLCWSLEKSRPYHARQSPRRPLQGQSPPHHPKLLRDMRHAPALRAATLGENDRRPARSVRDPHWTGAALSHRSRRVAGVGLPRREAGPVERLSGRPLVAAAKDKTGGQDRSRLAGQRLK